MDKPNLKRHMEDVDKWLDVATKRLANDGRKRVEKEILTHYYDALEDGGKRGKTLDEAHAAAMDSLGSARKAGKAFRRTYLTIRENRYLSAHETKSRGEKINRRVVLVGFFALPTVGHAFSEEGLVGMEFLSWAGLLVLMFIAMELEPYLFEIEARSRAMLWSIFSTIGSALVLVFLGWVSGFHVSDLVAVLLVSVLSMVAIFYVRRDWRLYRKIRIVG